MNQPATVHHKAVILEIGEIRTDGRCRNIAGSIKQWGAEVSFIGPGDGTAREDLDGITVHRLNISKRFGSKLLYIVYWIRAFWKSVLMRPALVIAEDLYSLPPAIAVKFFMGAKVMYDSKEIYFAMASLQKRPVTQRFWSAVEKNCIRYADAVITSGERDSDLIMDRYGIPRPVTINNHPPRRTQPGDKQILRKKFNIPEKYTIFLYQGWLMSGRGLYHLIDLAGMIETIQLVIMGDGSLREGLEAYARAKSVTDRVLFTGALPYEKMLEYTPGADVGCALIEDYGLSYRHARPNKMFEYIQSEVPVLVSSMPAMSEVIDEWNVGMAVEPDQQHEVYKAAKRFIEDKDFYYECVVNCKQAANVFHWGEEEIKIKKMLDSLYSNNM